MAPGELSAGWRAPKVWPKKIRALGGRAVCVVCNLKDRTQIAAPWDLAAAEFDRIDILAQQRPSPSSAAIACPLLELDAGVWDHFPGSQHHSPLSSGQKAVAARMIEVGRGGRIINIGSGHVQAGRQTRRGLCRFQVRTGRADVRGAALDLAEHGITVNSSLSRSHQASDRTSYAERAQAEAESVSVEVARCAY